ncbi:hypothetical protein BV210_13570 [Halorientalis sp. IM1011]|nr:hypothetical protein BV210_13570 [Halorientalis sp. IM1011]
MEWNELVQLLTLWFVVLIFMQTSSGTGDSQLLAAIGIFAGMLMFLLPLWIAIELVTDLGAEL